MAKAAFVDQIAQMQGSTGQAVRSIDGIAVRIRLVGALATSLAAAVEARDAATQEIVRNVTEVATRTGSVTTHATSVADAAAQVLTAASTWVVEAARLASAVERLLATVRAG